MYTDGQDQADSDEQRREAARALSAGLRANHRPLAFIFNTLVQDKAVSDRLRSYADPMDDRVEIVEGELRVACQLIELATQADPDSRDAHAARAEIYEQRRKQELSLMARGIYRHAAQQSASRARANGESSET